MKRLLTIAACVALLGFLLASCGKSEPAGGESSLDALTDTIGQISSGHYQVSILEEVEFDKAMVTVFAFVNTETDAENGGGSLMGWTFDHGALAVGEVRADIHAMLDDADGVAVFEESLGGILDAFAVSEETRETVRANMMYYSEDEVTHLLYADGLEIKSCRYPVEDITELVITVTKWTEDGYPEAEGVLIRQPYSIF